MRPIQLNWVVVTMYLVKSMLQFRSTFGFSVLKSSWPRRNLDAVYRTSTYNIRRSCYPSAGILNGIDSDNWRVHLPTIEHQHRIQKRQLFFSLFGTKSTEESCVQEPNPTIINGIESNTNGIEDEYSDCPILKDLNQNQIHAVTQPLSAITRVVAGPGSGKTRVLTSRIAYLLQEDRRNQILAVTFTRKAAGEMQHRVENLLYLTQEQRRQLYGQQNHQRNDDIVQESAVGADGKPTRLPPEGLERVSLGTFHSICAKILRWNGDRLSLLPSVISDMSQSSNQTVLDRTFNIVDQGEQLRVVKECLKQQSIDLAKYDLKPIDILSGIAACKMKIVKGENPFQRDNKGKPLPREDIIQKMYYPYREKLLSSNCIDFDDLIYLARELLLVNEDVRERLQKRWAHVLVDEFQDTSQSQLDLIKLLTSSSLFIVGDADQSIYSWRGAHAGSMTNFENDFKEFHISGVSTVYLMENYR
jgi:DNA helicase II / ATP-dependent DNA helicase PcrA